VRRGKRCRDSRKWTALGNQRRQLPRNIIHAALAESDAHFSDVAKLATIDDSKDQSAELPAPSARFCEAVYADWPLMVRFDYVGCRA
jgi:hypothetical protein